MVSFSTSPLPDRKKLRTRTLLHKARQLSRNRNIPYKRIIYIGMMGGGTFAIGGLVWIFFFSSLFAITQVRFDEQSIKQYEYLPLYTDIEKSLTAKHSLRASMEGYQSEQYTLQKKYGIIKNYSISFVDRHIILVHIDFSIPRFIYGMNQDIYTLSHRETFLPIRREDGIFASGLLLQVPSYITTRDDLVGIYRNVTEEQLYTTIRLILDILPRQSIASIKYIPGGDILMIETAEQYTLLFHLEKDINQQLVKRLDIQKHYKDLARYRLIDLGSVEFTIVGEEKGK